LARYGKPEIFNTDQGSQFTGSAFTQVLLDAEIRISMDGRGRWMDNVFIERLWRSLKTEEVYLKAYENAREVRARIGEWIGFYNELRPHQALGHRMPMSAWRSGTAGRGVERIAVDMPLRLDNADALSTYPPRQQQEQTCILV
jgi:putative transposase